MCSEPGFGASVSVSRTTTGVGSRSRAQALGREALAQIASVARRVQKHKRVAKPLMVALSIIMIDETRRRPGAPVLSSFVFLDRTASKLLICGLFQEGRVFGTGRGIRTMTGEDRELFDDDETTDDEVTEGRELLEYTKRIVDRNRKRGHANFWNAGNEDQGLMEVNAHQGLGQGNEQAGLADQYGGRSRRTPRFTQTA